MLTTKQRKLITYESITIYEKTYRLPIIKNTKLKKIQKKIRDSQRFIKEGIRYRNDFWGIIKRKKEISQGEIFQEIQLLIRDYSHVIDFLEYYKDNYQDFLLKFTDDWKSLFRQKYLEIKKLNEERNKLEIKNYKNSQIIDKLKLEKQENLKSILLLSNTNLLMLEKVELLSDGIKNLAEDTKNQKQTIQQIVKDLEVYQEIYEYQIKATKVRQEIAKIAETAINFENYLQDYFSPFQSLIDEVVKVDEDFYATVGEIQSLANNFLMGESNLLKLEEAEIFSHNIINSIVASYEKKERLNDALLQSELLNKQFQNFNFDNDEVSLEHAFELISSYIYNQFVDQRKVLGVVETKFSSAISASTEETGLVQLTNDDIPATKEFQISTNIDYTQLQNLLAHHQWKEADIETTKLMLQVIGKNYWNEVYKEDIQKFSCKHLQTIDQLWKQYSHGYFGFSVQQTIWSEIGGQIDYETEKILGDRLGWRKEGNWLDYDQLTFKLSSTTPIGHLPAKWLHYEQEAFDVCSNSSAEPLSMGAWRVRSWLIWQMHLFFSRVKICNVT
ncbi:GUN4 domain-containing protein [Nostoc sp. UHCC 0702]|nr:GUN4 domain-containing protein [Nostoc sp. UHCC 0702]